MKTNEETKVELDLMIHKYLSMGWTPKDILLLSIGAACSSIKELNIDDKGIDEMFRKFKKIVKEEMKTKQENENGK